MLKVCTIETGIFYKWMGAVKNAIYKSKADKLRFRNTVINIL